MDRPKSVVEDAIDSCLDRRISDWGKMKGVIKDSLGDFLWKRTKRNPMILPIIMEAYTGKLQAGTYLLSTAYTPNRIMAIWQGMIEDRRGKRL